MNKKCSIFYYFFIFCREEECLLDFYYLQLRKRYPGVREREELPITLPELAGIFQCSSRNVNLVIRRMEEAEWIRWIPGRGRGHLSRIVFLVPVESVVLERAQGFVEKGDIQQAFAFLEEQSHLPSVKDRFVYWLDTHFGYRPEVKGEERTDALRLPYSKPVHCLDPAMLTFVVESHIAQQIFDTLVKYNLKTEEIEGGLAHYWTTCENGTRWTFYLRKGVYFHNGREMTSHDVRFTLERLQSEELRSPFRWLFSDVLEVSTVDRYTVSMKLRRPNPLFLHHLSFDRASIVPEDAVSQLGPAFRRTPVGTGPFKVQQHDENMLVLEAFSRYYDKRAHLDRIEIWYTPELMRKASCIDSPAYMMRYQENRGSEIPKDWKVIETIGRDCSFIIFNLNIPGPQRQLAFRKAFMHGVDRQRLIPPGEEERTAFARWFYAVDQERSNTDDQYEPILARRYLAESGYEGETLILSVSKGFAEMAEAIASQLAGIGIRIEIRELVPGWQDYGFDPIRSAHLSLRRNVLDHDLELSIIELFLSDQCSVRTHLGEELQQQTDWLISRMYQEGSPLTREGYLNRLQQLIREEAHVFFLFQHTQRTVFHPSLKNVSLNALGWVQFRELWFEPIAH
ncbi:ABC transporter substrate-binding protein [Paenibacillus filicis]|uniref:ABC transporter substrate-binding protein n=1 Tax=Paenibacillus gyeongsangnamensis TaxID=3388067 RepID=A0ABT4Q5E2_9BACL|nr:ABC transporter substrate-binding protein [Paenibacillus filicis]MCZ8512089.1 ABC transporter substrate-binding protein [Paenibacillus filicis]